MTGQETCNELTNDRASNEAKPGQEAAMLIDFIHEERSGMSVK